MLLTLRPRIALALAALTLAAGLAPLRPAGAQRITFPAADSAGNASLVPNGYGATAGVATTFRSLDAFGDAAEVGVMRWWDASHGALVGVAYGLNRTGSVAEVGLRGTGPGGPVTLTGFDVGSWFGRSRLLFVRVLGWDYSPLYTIEAPIGAPGRARGVLQLPGAADLHGRVPVGIRAARARAPRRVRRVPVLPGGGGHAGAPAPARGGADLQSRRLNKGHQRLPATSEAMVYGAMLRLML